MKNVKFTSPTLFLLACIFIYYSHCHFILLFVWRIIAYVGSRDTTRVKHDAYNQNVSHYRHVCNCWLTRNTSQIMCSNILVLSPYKTWPVHLQLLASSRHRTESWTQCPSSRYISLFDNPPPNKAVYLPKLCNRTSFQIPKVRSINP